MGLGQEGGQEARREGLETKKAHQEKGLLLEPVGVEMPEGVTWEASKSGRPLEASQQNLGQVCVRPGEVGAQMCITVL